MQYIITQFKFFIQSLEIEDDNEEKPSDINKVPQLLDKNIKTVNDVSL